MLGECEDLPRARVLRQTHAGSEPEAKLVVRLWLEVRMKMHRSQPVFISAFALAWAIGGCSVSPEDTTKKAEESAAEGVTREPEKGAEVAKPEAKPAAATPIDVNVDEKGQGLHGYDPVAYQLSGKPTPGVASNSFE